jgi:hypothetical protein
VDEGQVFEFKGNALITFRVRVQDASLSISTLRKKGGPAEKTWHVDFERIETVQVVERRGASTRIAGLFIKPRGETVAMFAWQKNAMGARTSEAPAYYAAAIAALRAIAARRPDLRATIGPNRPFIGPVLSAVIFIAAAYMLIGEANMIFGLTAAAIAVIYAVSIATSGIFKSTRSVSLAEAADELAENARS